jgi:hypothetical protein
MAKNPKQFAAAAKNALKNGVTVQGEVNAVLKQLAEDATYASRFYEAVDADDRKEVISLLKAGGIKQGRIASLELFPGNLKVIITIDLAKWTITVTIDADDDAQR